MSMNSSVPRAGHRLPATPSAKGSPSGGHQPRSRRRGRSECGRPAPARPWRGADRRGRLHVGRGIRFRPARTANARIRRASKPATKSSAQPREPRARRGPAHARAQARSLPIQPSQRADGPAPAAAPAWRPGTAASGPARRGDATTHLRRSGPIQPASSKTARTPRADPTNGAAAPAVTVATRATSTPAGRRLPEGNQPSRQTQGLGSGTQRRQQVHAEKRSGGRELQPTRAHKQIDPEDSADRELAVAEQPQDERRSLKPRVAKLRLRERREERVQGADDRGAETSRPD